MPLRILITGFFNMRYNIGKWHTLLPANSINRLKPYFKLLHYIHKTNELPVCYNLTAKKIIPYNPCAKNSTLYFTLQTLF